MMFGSSGSEGDIWLDEHYTLHVKEGVTVQDIIPKVRNNGVNGSQCGHAHMNANVCLQGWGDPLRKCKPHLAV